MRRIIRTMKQLGAKAAELQGVIQSAPERAAELRQVFNQTASQFQQLRDDVQSGFHDLKSDNDNDLLKSLGEVEENSDVLLEAGFELIGVDLELGVSRTAEVKLEQIEEVTRSEISSLRARHSGRRTLSAVLECLIQASEVSNRIQLDGLTRFIVSVQLGTIPTVTVGWRPVLAFDDESNEELPPVLEQSSSTAKEATPPPLPDLVKGGFFEKKEFNPPVIPEAAPQPEQKTEVTKQPAAEAPPEPEPTPTPEPTKLALASAETAKPTPANTAPTIPEEPLVVKPNKKLEGNWRESALDRFKKMPKL